ncbi:MAG: Zn-ribbon domain-containing OB-fold protein [Chloroflexi bacterium]|nr:Zn-ribbon domain-containing OB-fold protein [Chloroflexota bacterium]
MTTEYTKPLPVPANVELSQPFWDAAKRHQLVLPRCNTCSKTFFYPRERCPECLSGDLSWSDAGGKGRVYSYTVIEQTVNRAFVGDVPYIYAMIQLDEGPRIISNVVDCSIENVYVDMPVTAVFDDVTPDVTLVKFRPV